MPKYFENTTAFNYNEHGSQYAGYRSTDPRIAQYVHAALGDARTVLNVGAGAGSYEPIDRYVVAIEPSAVMRAQRPAHLAPAIIATAGDLPFDDNAFDASMAMVTIHHWSDAEKGLKDLRRVTKGPVIIMTFDKEAVPNFWIAEYAPELIAVDRMRYQPIDFITAALGSNCEVQHIPVPIDCVDGFQEAFYARPEAFLDVEVRLSQSAWGFLADGVEEQIVKRLAADLTSGEWDRKYGHLRTQPEFTCALRLIISKP